MFLLLISCKISNPYDSYKHGNVVDYNSFDYFNASYPNVRQYRAMPEFDSTNPYDFLPNYYPYFDGDQYYVPPSYINTEYGLPSQEKY